MRACGIAVIWFANGLAGSAGSIPLNVAWDSVSATYGCASSRVHADAYVIVSVSTGRRLTDVRYVIYSPSIAVKNARADPQG